MSKWYRRDETSTERRLPDDSAGTVNCVFCEYAENGLPEHGIYENDEFIVVLDTAPIGAAHTLVIPRRHVPRVYDLSHDQQGRLFDLAARIVPVLLKHTRKSAVGYVAYGSGLPHAHLHLIPHNHSDELADPRVNEMERDDLARTASSLRKASHVLVPRTPVVGMSLMTLAVLAGLWYTPIGLALGLPLYLIGSAIVADSRISRRRKFLLTLTPAALIVLTLVFAYARN